MYRWPGLIGGQAGHLLQLRVGDHRGRVRSGDAVRAARRDYGRLERHWTRPLPARRSHRPDSRSLRPRSRHRHARYERGAKEVSAQGAQTQSAALVSSHVLLQDAVVTLSQVGVQSKRMDGLGCFGTGDFLTYWDRSKNLPCQNSTIRTAVLIEL